MSGVQDLTGGNREWPQFKGL